MGMLGKLAGFCGIEVITYCMMSNHFHLLIRIPEPAPLTDAQLLERVEAYYGRKGALTLLVRQAMTERRALRCHAGIASPKLSRYFRSCRRRISLILGMGAAPTGRP